MATERQLCLLRLGTGLQVASYRLEKGPDEAKKLLKDGVEELAAEIDATSAKLLLAAVRRVAAEDGRADDAIKALRRRGEKLEKRAHRAPRFTLALIPALRRS
jgi:hypothetical protein